MDVQNITHEARLQQWEKIVKKCRSSGKSIKAWCAENSINIKTYYRWQQLVCQATCQKFAIVKESKPQAVNDRVDSDPIFAELSMPASRTNQLAVAIKHNAMQINVYCGADADTVETVITAVRNLC
jgi:ABC-type uncharacterized transport system YnjBCD substrate-binding protein